MKKPSNTSSKSRPSRAMRKTFGSGRSGRYSASRSTAAGDRASIPCAPSPPSAFCQDQVTTSSLLKSTSIPKTAEVASHRVSPVRSRGIHSASGTRTPDVVPFQGKTTSCAKSTRVRSGSCP